MKKITDKLEEIVHLAKNPSESSKTAEAIKVLRTLVKDAKAAGTAGKESLERLSVELEVWQGKLSVILKEPAGREGMARHAKHWVEELRKINV